jgi:hypothetical protein
MMSSSSSILLTIVEVLIFAAPILIVYKTLAEYRWPHIIFTELLLYYFAYFAGPLGPYARTIPLINSPEYWFNLYYARLIQTSLLVGYSVVGCALIWSILSLKSRWYESGMLLHYMLFVFVEFIVLIPLAGRLVWGI